MEQNIPVDITVLCDFLDQLCIVSVLSKRFSTQAYHGITMPRSWLLSQANRFDILARGRDLRLVICGLYTKNIPLLIEKIYMKQRFGNWTF